MNSNKRIAFTIFAVIVFTTYLMTETSTSKRVDAQEISANVESEIIDTFDNGPVDQISETDRDEIWTDVRKNIEILTNEGKLTAGYTDTPATVSLAWPTAKASALRDFNIGMIPYFVDQNPAFPNQILDWNCGTRTYDDATGYNHRGTDIVSFPFPWDRMDNNEALVVAAADGVIVSKTDGNFDRNCGGVNPVNRIIIMHPDNSKAWYLHLKNGSLTRKSVGENVTAGEYLGIAGSSGDANVPHLHFELYNSQDQLQDPYLGTCNMMNNFSWWANQEPYRNSRINTLMTASEVPVSPGCPQQEITYEKIVFQPLDQLVTVAAIRDIMTGQTIQFSILRPDQSVFQSWTFMSQSTLNATIRAATWQLPADAPTGAWKYSAVFNGQVYEQIFYVGQPPDVSVSGHVTTLSGIPIPDATVIMGIDQPLPGTQFLRKAATDALGGYHFDNVVVGRRYRIYVVADNFEFLLRKFTFAENVSDLDFFSINEN